MGAYHIKKSTDSLYYWVLKANNHEIILTATHRFATKNDVINSIENSRACLKTTDFSPYQDSQYKYYFLQHTSVNSNIARSEPYNTKQGCFEGIQDVIRYAPTAKIVDDTVGAKTY